jgi:sec-independent protein translocase protein TatC
MASMTQLPRSDPASAARQPLAELEADGATMTLIEHLEELRHRLLIAAIAIVIGSVLAFVWREQILSFLLTPLPADAEMLTHGGGTPHLVVTGVTEAFTVYVKMALAVGIILASPVILYELWAFIAPGLTRQERRYAAPFVLIGLVLFVAGIVVGFVVLRYPVNWLVTFGKANFLELVTADNYFSFVAFFLLAFGITFELPLVLTFLARLDILSAQTLRKKRPVALVILWLIAGVITPGADPYSPIIIGISLTLLYELSVLLIRLSGK